MTGGNPFELGGDDLPYHPPPALRGAWEAGCRRLLVHGANGMGKSAALAAWAGWVGAGARPVRAPDWPPDEGGWWLLDEAQHHRGAALRQAVQRALARGQGVAITSHLPHRWTLRGLGFTSVRLAGLADDEALAALVADYLHRRRTAWDIAPEALTAWRNVTGGNVRAALAIGYELYESHGAEARITACAVGEAAATLARDAPDVLAWRRVERLHRRPGHADR